MTKNSFARICLGTLVAILLVSAVAIPGAFALWTAQDKTTGTAQAGTLSVSVTIDDSTRPEPITYRNLMHKRLLRVANDTQGPDDLEAEAVVSVSAPDGSPLAKGEAVLFQVDSAEKCETSAVPAGSEPRSLAEGAEVSLTGSTPGSKSLVCMVVTYDDWSPLVSESGEITTDFTAKAQLNVHNFHAEDQTQAPISTEGIFPPVTVIDGFLQLELADNPGFCLEASLMTSASDTDTARYLWGTECYSPLSYTDPYSFTQQLRMTTRDDSLRWLNVTTPARPGQQLRGPQPIPAMFYTPTEHEVAWWEILPESDGTFRLHSGSNLNLCLSVMPYNGGLDQNNAARMKKCDSSDRSQYLRLKKVLPADGTVHKKPWELLPRGAAQTEELESAEPADFVETNPGHPQLPNESGEAAQSGADPNAPSAGEGPAVPELQAIPGLQPTTSAKESADE